MTYQPIPNDDPKTMPRHHPGSGTVELVAGRQPAWMKGCKGLFHLVSEPNLNQTEVRRRKIILL